MKLLSLQERVEQLIQTPEGITESNSLLTAIRSNYVDAQTKLQQTRYLILVPIILFIVVNTGVLKEFEFLGLKFENKYSPLIISFIPILISYFYFEMISLFVTRRLLIGLHELLVKKTHSSIHNSLLTEFYLPSSPFLTLNLLSVKSAKNKKWIFFIKDIGGLVGAATIVIPIFLNLYLYFLASKLIFASGKDSNFVAQLIFVISIPISITFISNIIFFLVRTLKVIQTHENQVDTAPASEVVA